MVFCLVYEKSNLSLVTRVCASITALIVARDRWEHALITHHFFLTHSTLQMMRDASKVMLAPIVAGFNMSLVGRHLLNLFYRRIITWLETQWEVLREARSIVDECVSVVEGKCSPGWILGTRWFFVLQMFSNKFTFPPPPALVRNSQWALTNCSITAC